MCLVILFNKKIYKYYLKIKKNIINMTVNRNNDDSEDDDEGDVDSAAVFVTCVQLPSI